MFLKKDNIEFLVRVFEAKLRDIDIQTDGFDFDWPIYRRSLIEDFRFFMKYYNDSDSKRVLDIGVGIGLTSFILSNLGFSVSSCDIRREKRNMDILFDQRAVFKAKFMHNIEFKYSKSEELPFDDLTFDAIFLYAVIEHVEEVLLGSFVGEINRVLKKKGRVFIFKCPQKYSYSEFLSRKLFHSGHKYLWTIRKLRELFAQVNFTLEEYRIYDFFLMTLIKKKYPFSAILTRGLLCIEPMFLWTPLSKLFHNIKCVFIKQSPEILKQID